MRSRQTGITLIGWLFLLVPIGIVLYAGIRLTPMYLNYMKVAQAIEQTVSEFKGGEQVSPAAVRVALGKRFDIQSISYPEVKDVRIAREGSDWVIEADFEDVAPLFADISLLVHFQKRAVAN